MIDGHVMVSMASSTDFDPEHFRSQLAHDVREIIQEALAYELKATFFV